MIADARLPTAIKVRYFPGLDTIRFYAAIAVVVAHLERNFAELRSQPAIFEPIRIFFIDAQIAVTLFFVLSGFLITYLLLAEYERTAGVQVRNFYIRRILRIWPLYYLIAIPGILLFPALGADQVTTGRAALILFLLANFAGPLGPLGHLWSIAIEEQFYLMWPLVLRRGPQVLLKIAGGVIIIKLMLAPMIASMNIVGAENLLVGLRFEAMAIGALGAYLYHRQHPLLHWLYHRLTQAIVPGICVLYMIFDQPYTALVHMMAAVVWMVLLLNVATNPRALLHIDVPVVNQLGKISYGIYMYHFPVLYLILYAFQQLNIPEGPITNVGLYITVIGGTLLVAALSYRFFEQPFLRLKERFAATQAE
jgi:peptidoglycan/LPS O-acetylase OafA/YrhL